MLIGYCRISTPEQAESLVNQEKQLQEHGCEKIFTDVASGTKAHRPGLQAALDYAREGETIVVTRLDRLGRTTLDTLRTVQKLDERGIKIQALDVNLDTATPAGRLVLNVIASLAQWERDLLVERTKEGLAYARSQGRVGGRPPALSEDGKKAVIAAIEQGMSENQVAQTFNVSRSTVSRIKRDHKDKRL